MFAIWKMPTFYTVLVLSFYHINLFAQVTAGADSSNAELKEIEISSDRIRHTLQLHETEGTGIFAGKRTDVVLPENLDANVALNNARQVFGKVAGMINLENDGSGLQNNLAFRGLSPNRSWEFNTRQNGYDISADNFGYPEAYYTPPMELVQRIEVVRGASSLQFGPQIGGMINYVLKKAPVDRRFSVESRQTAGSYGLFNTFNAVGGTLGKFNYYASGQFRRGDGWRENSQFSTHHLYGNVGYTFGQKANISAEITRSNYLLQVSGGLTDAQFKADPRQSHRSRNWFNVPWTMAAVVFNWQPSVHTKINVKGFGLSGERNSIGVTAAITTPDTLNRSTGLYPARQIDQFAFKNVGLEARLLQEYTFAGRQHALAVGARLYQGDQTRWQRGKGDRNSDFNLDLQEERFPSEMGYTTKNAAAFAENILRAGRFAITTGLRYEFVRSDAAGRIGVNSQGSPIVASPVARDRHLLLAGAGAEYHLRGNNEFYANISGSYRPVLFSDLTPAATTDVIDPNLKDAKGANIDLGYRGTWKEWLHLDLGVYHLLYKNRIGSLTQLQSDGVTRYQFRTNLGNSRSYGAEMYVEADILKAFGVAEKWGDVQIFGALAWNHARYGDFEITSVQNNQIVKGNLDGNQVEYAPAYIHRYGATYSSKCFSTSFTVSQVASVFTDANNTVAPSANGQAGQLPKYAVMDWSSTIHLKKHYTLAAGINNLTNAAYAARRAGGAPGPGLLPGEGRTGYLTLGAKF